MGGGREQGEGGGGFHLNNVRRTLSEFYLKQMCKNCLKGCLRALVIEGYTLCGILIARSVNELTELLDFFCL